VHSAAAIGVARGTVGAPAPSQGGEKIFFRRNLQGKCVSAPPSHSKSQFLGQFLLGGLYLDGL